MQTVTDITQLVIYTNWSQISLHVHYPLMFLNPSPCSVIHLQLKPHTQRPVLVWGVWVVTLLTLILPLRLCVSPVFTRCALLTANVPDPIWDKVGGSSSIHTQTHWLSLTCTGQLGWLLMWCRSSEAFSQLSPQSHFAHTHTHTHVSLPSIHLNKPPRWYKQVDNAGSHA